MQTGCAAFQKLVDSTDKQDVPVSPLLVVPGNDSLFVMFSGSSIFDIVEALCKLPHVIKNAVFKKIL